MVIDVFLETLADTYYIIPILFVTYLILEYFEHYAGDKIVAFLNSHRKSGPALGAIFGVIPECGLSSAACSLYSDRLISAGTLIAIFLSTSDEMLPIMVSSQFNPSLILKILCVKIAIALGAGYLANWLFPFIKHLEEPKEPHTHGPTSVFKFAFERTVSIFTWIIGVSFVLNLVIELIGMDTLLGFISSYPHSSVLTCTLLGLIPNCAPSVILTSMYMQGLIPFAAICAGLLMNAGVGVMTLFKVNHNHHDNVRIVGYLFTVSLCSGILIGIFGI